MSKLSALPPSLKPLFDKLITPNPNAVFPTYVIDSICVSDFCSDGTNESIVERVDVWISFCHRRACKAEIILNPANYRQPPDLLVQPLHDFRPVIYDFEDVYTDWNPRDKLALVKLMSSLRSSLKLHHRARVEAFPNDRIKFEFSSLQHLKDMDCAFFEEKNEPPLVVFDIPVVISTDDELLIRDNENITSISSVTVRLLVEFRFQLIDRMYELDQVERSIWMPESLSSNQIAFKLPPYHKTRHIVEYISELEQTLKASLDALESNVTKRKSFLLSMASTFSSQLLEYDSTNFSFISFLFECAPRNRDSPRMSPSVTSDTILRKDLLTAVTHIQIPDKFPDEAPVLKLISPFQFKIGSLTSEPEWTIIKWNYSSRWRCEELVKRIRVILADEIPNFVSRLNIY
ncbi:hypothetical protein BKA69DRAFT_1076897 [Paraphysoderma sedebokerense]|nr:hypothetical protein BKA69DRAFT_1076897 [Paraphysoderma sedebokerense]